MLRYYATSHSFSRQVSAARLGRLPSTQLSLRQVRLQQLVHLATTSLYIAEGRTGLRPLTPRNEVA